MYYYQVKEWQQGENHSALASHQMIMTHKRNTIVKESNGILSKPILFVAHIRANGKFSMFFFNGICNFECPPLVESHRCSLSLMSAGALWKLVQTES